MLLQQVRQDSAVWATAEQYRRSREDVRLWTGFFDQAPHLPRCYTQAHPRRTNNWNHFVAERDGGPLILQVFLVPSNLYQALRNTATVFQPQVLENTH